MQFVPKFFTYYRIIERESSTCYMSCSPKVNDTSTIESAMDIASVHLPKHKKPLECCQQFQISFQLKTPFHRMIKANSKRLRGKKASGRCASLFSEVINSQTANDNATSPQHESFHTEKPTNPENN